MIQSQPCAPGSRPSSALPVYGRRYILDRQGGEWLVWDPLIYSWLILGFGSNYVCNDSACFDRYTLWWGLLLLLHFVVIVAAIILWVIPRTRVWGLILGFVGTGVAAIVFTVAFGVPL